MEHIFRIVDFNVYNAKETLLDSSDEEPINYKDSNQFIIQVFGVDELGKTYSLIVEGFKPFFYVLVNDSWNISQKENFINHLKEKMGKYYKDSITNYKIIKRKKLYGFDGGKEHKFLFIEFSNMNSFNKAKNLWYSNYNDGHILLKDGYLFNNTNLILYEANIPPLLRFFHINNISPSGWIAIPKKKMIENKFESKKVNCDYEFTTNFKNIIALNEKETRVPYKILSFDIEASSSHGDFPVPIKTYKKLATNIIEFLENLNIDLTFENCKKLLRKIILSAFGYEKMTEIDLVYPKIVPKSKEDIEKLCELWMETKIVNLKSTQNDLEENTIENLFEKMGLEEEEDENLKKNVKKYLDKKATIIEILCDKKFEREGKVIELNESLKKIFPKLEGDKVTFIGSTFMKYGEKEPYFNHCIVLNSCSKLLTENN